VRAIQDQFDVAPICQRDGGDAKGVDVTTTIMTLKPPLCAAGWSEFQGSCYLLKTSPLDWNDAEADCAQTHRGYLASVLSGAEHDFVSRMQPCRLSLDWSQTEVQ
jgi:hypothetical protein